MGEQNIQYINAASLRSLISTVPQQIDLFSGTIIQNIALGEMNPDLKKVLNICSKLDLLTFIEELPDGFNTQLGEHGVGLSGGQKQRIAIARALYREPKLLIMDEATSALDSHSESIVQKVIEKFNAEGNTVILIAHRLSTVMHADKIVILDKGSVIEEGKHDDLYNEGFAYFELWKKQIPVLNT